MNLPVSNLDNKQKNKDISTRITKTCLNECDAMDKKPM